MSSNFQSLGVPEDLAAHLAARSIGAPFPIQSATIPDAIKGSDICGRAATGSGKTLAFGLPTMMRVGRAKPNRPLALVLAPTRELAAQIASELSLLGKVRGRRVASFYGGVGYGAQLNALARGVDVAVACPGRLLDLVERGSIRLSEVEIVVIDEADRMADMGFMPVVRKLLDQVPSTRQTMLFSATLDRDVEELIRRYQRNPVRAELDTPETTMERQTHRFLRADSSERVALVTKIVADQPSTIVFCRTKHGVDRLARQLKQAGISVAPLHGDRSQGQRDRALESFRNGQVKVLVGTDVAARGLDVDGVSCVVHFDPPADEKTYVHRSGRTARAGAAGLVVSLVSGDQVSLVRKMQSALGMPLGVDHPDAVDLSEASPVTLTERPSATTQSSARTGGTPKARTTSSGPGSRRRRMHPPRQGQGSSGSNGGVRTSGRSGR